MSKAIAGIDPKTKRCELIGVNNPENWEECRKEGWITVPCDSEECRKIWGETIEDVYSLTTSEEK